MPFYDIWETERDPWYNLSEDGTMSRKETDGRCFPTPYDNFLYLLFELERAVERNGIDWSAASSREIPDRLRKIAAKVVGASNRGGGGVIN
jgi:hypothetical protein